MLNAKDRREADLRKVHPHSAKGDVPRRMTQALLAKKGDNHWITAVQQTARELLENQRTALVPKRLRYFVTSASTLQALAYCRGVFAFLSQARQGLRAFPPTAASYFAYARNINACSDEISTRCYRLSHC